MTAADHSPAEHRIMDIIYARAVGLHPRFRTLDAALADELVGKTLRIAARAITTHPRRRNRSPQPPRED